MKKPPSTPQPKSDAALVGQVVLFTVPIENRGTEQFQVFVRVLDVRNAYGRTDYKVEPRDGRGSAWVRKSSLEVE